MKRCGYCNGRMGLISHRYYNLRFDKRTCLEAYKREMGEAERSRRFLAYLARAPT